MSIVEQVQADATGALRSGDRPRAQALRLVASELQKASKEAAANASETDELAILRRERKRRLEAAEAYSEAGRTDLAAAERGEAELIESYPPLSSPTPSSTRWSGTPWPSRARPRPGRWVASCRWSWSGWTGAPTAAG
jgi:uncharacterized protein YqeY